VSNENSIISQIAADILTVAFDLEDIDHTIEGVPSRRVKTMILSGDADGTTIRVRSFGDKVPGLIRVHPPIGYVVTAAFVREDSNVDIFSREDLNLYRVGITAGTLHAQAATALVPSVEIVETPQQLMRALDVGRIDVAVHSSLEGDAILRELGIRSIERTTTPLGVLEGYAYLRDEHAWLAYVLSNRLYQMQATKEVTTIFYTSAARILDSIAPKSN